MSFAKPLFMFALVTGCAGFIGSHLTERLLSEGNYVIGIDCFTDYYSRKLKENNMCNFIDNPNFIFIRKHIEDITSKDIMFNNLKEVDIIFHLAAQAGVRASWGDDFRYYTLHTFETVQKMLEVARKLNIKKFVYASSSSVYGNYLEIPMKESTDKELWPISPYGITKLAGEKLCRLYHDTYNLPIAQLRYFTVYGPRQRPDMGFMKFINSIVNDKEIIIYGDGNQTRDFTYVSDVIDATMAAATAKIDFETINIGGGSCVTVNDVLKILEKVTGKQPKLKFIEKQLGDMQHTYADISKAQAILNYAPKIGLEQGLKSQFEWYTKEFVNLGI